MIEMHATPLYIYFQSRDNGNIWTIAATLETNEDVFKQGKELR